MNFVSLMADTFIPDPEFLPGQIQSTCYSHIFRNVLKTLLFVISIYSYVHDTVYIHGIMCSYYNY